MTKRLIVLADSRRPGGHCVAGVEDVAGTMTTWIRPIGGGSEEALRGAERRYASGESIGLLDIAEVRLVEPRPNPIQPENWLIGPLPAWRLIRRATLGDLDGLLHHPSTLWVNESSSSNGVNNRVDPEVAATLGYSLALIRVADLEFEVFTSPYGSQRKLRAGFSWAGDDYVLDVTDPTLEGQYFSRGEGTYAQGPAYVTVSLGTEYRGFCYKLAAAVIPAGR